MNIARTSPSTRSRRRVTLSLAMALVLAAIGVTAGTAGPAAAASGPITFNIYSPTNGSHYSVGEYATAIYSCEVDGFVYPTDRCIGTLPNGAKIDTSTPGTFTFQVHADFARNVYYSDLVTYYVDAPPVTPTTPPSVTLTSPIKGKAYDVGAAPLATYSCTAGSKPIKSCVGTDTWSTPVSLKKTAVANGKRVPALVGNHTFTVVATDTGGTTASKTVAFTIANNYKPDAIIAGKGNNVYNNLPPQTTIAARKLTTQVIPITIQNDGKVADRIKLKGDGTQTVKILGVPVVGWSVGYYERGACAGCLGRDITKWVVGGTYLAASLVPGASRTYYMAIVATPFATPVNRTVTATSSANPGAHDAVRATLR